MSNPTAEKRVDPYTIIAAQSAVIVILLGCLICLALVVTS